MDLNVMNMVKYFIMGTRVNFNDEEEIAVVVKDMYGGELLKYIVEEDVVYVFDYIIDCVDVEVED